MFDTQLALAKTSYAEGPEFMMQDPHRDLTNLKIKK